MKKNEKNEELQSRREFFKKAAKGALPILGAIVLANAPAVINAAEKARWDAVIVVKAIVIEHATMGVTGPV